jgi:hypothetical protein
MVLGCKPRPPLRGALLFFYHKINQLSLATKNGELRYNHTFFVDLKGARYGINAGAWELPNEIELVGLSLLSLLDSEFILSLFL